MKVPQFIINIIQVPQIRNLDLEKKMLHKKSKTVTSHKIIKIQNSMKNKALLNYRNNFTLMFNAEHYPPSHQHCCQYGIAIAVQFLKYKFFHGSIQ